jgi:hypothetical protein
MPAASSLMPAMKAAIKDKRFPFVKEHFRKIVAATSIAA